MRQLYRHTYRQIYRYILPAVVAVLTLTSCGNEDFEPGEVRDYPTFSARIEGSASRAYDMTWETGDKIGIYGGGATNISHTHQGNGTFKVTNDAEQIVFTDYSEVEFTAYYPYGTLSKESNYLGTIATYAKKNLVQKLADQKSFDYLWAEASGSKAAPNVKFTFAHQMSKITLVFTSEDGVDVSAITSYTIAGLYLRGTFDPLSGKCETTTESRASTTLTLNTYDSSNKNIKVKENEEAPPIIVFPQTLDSNTLDLSVSAANAGIGTLTGNLIFNDNKLEPGKNYQFIVNLSKTGVTVNSSTIKGWDNKDQGDAWEAM